MQLVLRVSLLVLLTFPSLLHSIQVINSESKGQTWTEKIRDPHSSRAAYVMHRSSSFEAETSAAAIKEINATLKDTGNGESLWTLTQSGVDFQLTKISKPRRVFMASADGGNTGIVTVSNLDVPVPLWTYSRYFSFGWAARDADVFAVSPQAPIFTFHNFSAWYSGKPTPDWTITVNYTAGYSLLTISPDGRLIEAAVSQGGPGTVGRSLLVDVNSSRVLYNWDYVSLLSKFSKNGALKMSLRYENRQSYVTIFDTQQLKTIYQLITGEAVSTVALSQSGQHAFYGGKNLYALKWNTRTATFNQIWMVNAPEDFYLLNTVSAGRYLVTSWSGLNFHRIKIAVYSLDSPVALWSMTTPSYVGKYQDSPSDMGITDDGKFFAIASWGNLTSSCPTLRVFATESGNQIYSLATPGSLFSVDLVEGTQPGTLNVVVGGRTNHANQFGDGGYLQSLAVSINN